LKVLKCGEEEIMERGKYKNTEGEKKKVGCLSADQKLGDSLL
jgi:hypothetical protein